MSKEFKKGDWVLCHDLQQDGRVIRVADDGSWVDVDWHSWSKRMRPCDIKKTDTIKRGDLTITIHEGD